MDLLVSLTTTRSEPGYNGWTIAQVEVIIVLLVYFLIN
jgi:hypothetical protein